MSTQRAAGVPKRSPRTLLTRAGGGGSPSGAAGRRSVVIRRRAPPRARFFPVPGAGTGPSGAAPRTNDRAAARTATASATSRQPWSMVSECAAVGELEDVGDGLGVPVLLERRLGDGLGDGVVLAAHDQQQRAAARVVGVDLRPASAG